LFLVWYCINCHSTWCSRFTCFSIGSTPSVYS